MVKDDSQDSSKAPNMGLCDSGCGEPATTFFLDTAVATCGGAKCVDYQNERWIQHCAEMDSQKD
jgi:hypothetical protein